MSINNIVFLQPAVPSYRDSFFQDLKLLCDFKVITSDIDFLNVKTVSDSEYINIAGGFNSFFNVFYWQSNLPYRLIFNSDVCVIPGNPRILNYMLIYFARLLIGRKVIWWGQGWTAGSRSLASSFRRYLARFADFTVLYTDSEAVEFNTSTCIGLNNGIDSFKCFDRAKKIRIQPFDSDYFNVLFIGRLSKKSDIINLVKMILEGDWSLPVQLYVVGDGELFNECNELVSSFYSPNKVTFLGVLYDDDDILIEYMINSKAFIYTGSVGLSLLHAFSYGLPAILHSNFLNHMPEFTAFKDGFNGFSYEQYCVQDFVFSLQKLIDLSPEEYSRFSSNALSTVSKSFNTRDMALRFYNVFKSLVRK